MPRRSRPGKWSILYAELPPPLHERVKAAAKANHRSVTAELIHTLESVYPDPALDGAGKKLRPKPKKSSSQT